VQKLIRFCGLLFLVIIGLSFNGGIAQAHSLKTNNGFSAVMHIDPDDDPLANQPTVLNFLIGNEKLHYTQTDYRNSVTISANGTVLKKLSVDQSVFGNAGDGIAKYTFPSVNVYTVDLRGVLISDPSVNFHMSFIVRVTGTLGTVAVTNGRSSEVILIGAGSLVVLSIVGFTVIRNGGRYAAKQPIAAKKLSKSKNKK
jgi:hypothetical protein